MRRCLEPIYGCCSLCTVNSQREHAPRSMTCPRSSLRRRAQVCASHGQVSSGVRSTVHARSMTTSVGVGGAAVRWTRHATITGESARTTSGSGDDADTPTVRRSRPLLAADTGHQRGYGPRGSVLFLGASGGVLAWCAAATYSSFPLAGWAHSPLPATTSLVSELEATGQPHHLFFRLTGVLSGIAILAVAALCTRCLPPTTRARSGCVLLAVLGIATIADGATQMACAPSIDVVCRDQEESVHGLLAQLAQLHTVSGLIGFAAATSAMLLIGTATEPRTRVFRLVSIGCGLGVASLGLIDIPLLLTNSVIGLGERGRVLLISIWLAGLGAWMLAQAFPRCGCVRSGGGGMRGLAP